MKVANSDIDALYPLNIDFPPVVIDQTNFRISDVIKRNRAGEQVLGHTNLQYDFDYKDTANFDKINPFNTLGMDLDDILQVAKDNNAAVIDLQNKLGEFDARLDTSKDVKPNDQSNPQPPAAAPAAAPQG